MELGYGKDEKINLIAAPSSNTWMGEAAEFLRSEYPNINVLPSSKDLGDITRDSTVLGRFLDVQDRVKSNNDPGAWSELAKDDEFVSNLESMGIGVVWVTPYVKARMQGKEYVRPVFISGLVGIENGEKILLADDALAEGKTVAEMLGGISKYNSEGVLNVVVSLSKRIIQDTNGNALEALRRYGNGGGLVETVSILEVVQNGDDVFVSVNGGVAYAQ